MIVEEHINQLMNNLARNNMTGYFAKDEEALFEQVCSLIPAGVTVGCGDSVTLEQTGLFDFLRRGEYLFLDKHKQGLSAMEKRGIYLQNFSAHTFITGTNALTMDGKLFNIDGNGSRMAPVIYGPKQVIVVVGTNKIVCDVNAALERVRQIAAPLDAKRLGKNTPCASLGKCVDCRHEQRICNSFVLITGQFDAERIKVIVVGKALGY